MPPQVVILAILAGIVVLLVKTLSGGAPGNAGKVIRRTLGGGAMVIGVFLLSRGFLPAAIPFFLIGLAILGFGSWVGLNVPWAQKTPGQRSSVRTEMLAMDLDHDSGDLDGEVLSGTFAGKRLADLNLEQLMLLRGECLSVTDQSTALLDAYLDRMHPEWRGEDGESAAGDTGPSTGADMTANEAYNILGLQRGSSAAEIRKAHRRMMKKFHPDHGGSEYLARKINQARDVLLAGA